MNLFSPKFELPVVDSAILQKKQLFVCDYCGEKGHKIASCFKLNPEHRQTYQIKVKSDISFLNALLFKWLIVILSVIKRKSSKIRNSMKVTF